MGEMAVVASILLVASIFVFKWVSEKRRAEELRLRDEQEREKLRLRTEDLIARFGWEVASAILIGEIKQGMTIEHLLESWGYPEDVDKKVFETKVSETWKYGEIGKNRYSSRVFLEDGFIVGWEQK